jgi:hypothetical protein
MHKFDGNAETADYAAITRKFQDDVANGRPATLLPSRAEHQSAFVNCCDLASRAHKQAVEALIAAAQPLRQQVANALKAEANIIDMSRVTEAQDYGHTHTVSTLAEKLRTEAATLERPIGHDLKALLPFFNL